MTPEPLTPADADLRSFSFMPLDVPRFRKSKALAVLTPEQFMPWLSLILESWHQLPAASLPDDDIELASLAGFGRQVNLWTQVREGALYGWVKCSDGRLYHPLVAEKATEVWELKVADRYRAYKGYCKSRGIEPDDLETWRARGQHDTTASAPKRKAIKNRDRLAYELAVRQRGLCGICGRPLDEDLSRSHLDHVVPLARGGADDPSNLQVAHAICNLRKGPRVLR